VKYAEIWK